MHVCEVWGSWFLSGFGDLGFISFGNSKSLLIFGSGLVWPVLSFTPVAYPQLHCCIHSVTHHSCILYNFHQCFLDFVLLLISLHLSYQSVLQTVFCPALVFGIVPSFIVCDHCMLEIKGLDFVYLFFLWVAFGCFLSVTILNWL